MRTPTPRPSGSSELRKLTSLPGSPTVIALTHPTKNPERDNLLPRGGGAFLNETDGNLTLWANDERTITALGWAGKFRGAAFDPINFALEKGTCSTLVDELGRPIPSVWAFPTDQAHAGQATADRHADDDAVLFAMLSFPKGSMSDWARKTPSGEPAKWKVQRAIERLAKHKLVTQSRDEKWTLTKKGKAEAERVEGDLN
jgi:hypothetical protein